MGSASTEPTQSEIRGQLERILAAPLFQNSHQLNAFLRFPVEGAIAGRSEQLKEYVIGVEVLKRGDAFDPREDPAVRIVAGRLRSKLAEYYQGPGQADAVVITLPRGGYVPTFEYRGAGAGVRLKRRTLAIPRWLVWVTGGGSLLAISWLSFGLMGRIPARRMPAPVPLTSYPGEEREPSFSPDGERVAFSWNGERQDNFDIYIKQTGRDKAVRLTTDSARDFSPAWSPDGRTIAFGRVIGPYRSAIFLIPPLGGPERKLTESTFPFIFLAQPFLAWSPDGKWIAFTDVDPEAGGRLSGNGTPPMSLFLISVETGEKRNVTRHVGDTMADAGPAFAPDGHALAFIRTQSMAITELHVLPLSPSFVPAGEPRPLTSWNVFTSSPSWTPNSKEIVVASGRWGHFRLWQMDEAGRTTPRRLDFLGGGVNEPTISRQGQLTYSQRSSDINIWRAELARPGVIAGPPARFIASTGADHGPQFSSDGKRIAFASDRGGSREIWVCDADGSNTMQLTSIDATMTANPAWSPDGSRIMFDSNREGQGELYFVGASGGPVKRITNNLTHEVSGPWSHDGRWIYFMSNRSGAREIWKMPSDGGEAVRMTRNGGVVSYLSRDGDYLYYSEKGGAGEGNGAAGLRRMRLSDGSEERVLDSVTLRNVAIVEDGIYFIPRADSQRKYSVYFYSFQTRTPSPVVRLSGPVSEGLAVSPDSRILLYSQIDEQKGDLMLVENLR